METEYPDCIPQDPPKYVENLKYVEGKEDWHFDDEFDYHFEKFGQAVWDMHPLFGHENGTTDGTTNMTEALLGMYVARRRLKEFMQISRGEQWTRGVCVP